jgi:alkanesulfonate monooxygenase SsuD/methylene tetrahydromethanopterin reductase-like flavin-dependent oxidoreductase (luciferase family)
MAAFTPAAMKRAAREADGWFPVGIPLSAVGGMFENICSLVHEAGRDRSQFKLVVRGNTVFTDSISGERRDFAGNVEQIAQDIVTTRNLGAHELVLDVQFSPGVNTTEDILRRMEELRRVAF